MHPYKPPAKVLEDARSLTQYMKERANVTHPAYSIHIQNYINTLCDIVTQLAETVVLHEQTISRLSGQANRGSAPPPYDYGAEIAAEIADLKSEIYGRR